MGVMSVNIVDRWIKVNNTLVPNAKIAPGLQVELGLGLVKTN